MEGAGPVTDSFERVMKDIEEAEIRLVYLIFMDTNNRLYLKNLQPAELRNWADGICVNGSFIEDFREDPNSDYLLIEPDTDTFRRFTWIDEPEGRAGGMICDLRGIELSSRRCLKKAMERAGQLGFLVMAGNQFIYTFDHGSAGSRNVDLPDSPNTRFRNELVRTFDSMGIDVEFGMMLTDELDRIDLVPKTALTAADNMSMAKLVFESLSVKRQLANSMMVSGGNSVTSPLHLSLWDGEVTRNLFYDPEDPEEFSVIGKRYINGILSNMELIVFLLHCLTAGEYRPGGLERRWSTRRDNAFIQIPMYFREKAKKVRSGWSKRVVLEGIPNCVNPYLLYSLVINAGLEGVTREYDRLPDDAPIDAVPLDELAVRFVNSSLVHESFGERLSRHVAGKCHK